MAVGISRARSARFMTSPPHLSLFSSIILQLTVFPSRAMTKNGLGKREGKTLQLPNIPYN
jgi:hypothetical protein